MSARRRKGKCRKPGLWLQSLRIEAEDVKKAHKQLCCECDERPENRRLKVTKGAGRHATSKVYCIAHGIVVLQDLVREGKRGVRYLATGKGEIRL